MKPRHSQKHDNILACQLFEALEEHNLKVIKTLLQRDKANPNLVLADKGISAFHFVIGSDNLKFSEEATRLFLQHNGDPNVRSEDGLTPVHVAAVWGRSSLVMLLLACGGNPWLRDSEDELTPLHLALREHHLETALLLQRFQLLDQRSRNSEARNFLRFNLNLEKIVLDTGDLQAEYGTSPRVGVSHFQAVPVQECIQSKANCGWNIDPGETQDYVSQWCHKEFSPRPITSTPRPVFSSSCNETNYEPAEITPCVTRHCSNYTSNTTAHIGSPPVLAKNSSDTPAVVETMPQKTSLKNTVDVRKKLFLELKKRFSGLKQSFESSKEIAKKKTEFDRRGKLGYFSKRKKKGRAENNNASDITSDTSSDNVRDVNFEGMSVEILKSQLQQTMEESELFSSCEYIEAREDVSEIGASPVLTVDALDEVDGISVLKESSSDEVDAVAVLKNNSTDEVDAIPLLDPSNISVEWIASHSCFPEQDSPNSTNSQVYFTCDEATEDIERSCSPQPVPWPHPCSSSGVPSVEKSKIPIAGLLLPTAPMLSPAAAPDEPIFKVPQRPPRRKQLTALNASSKTASSDAQSVATFGSIVSEEYRYTDNEEGVVLLETRLLASPIELPGQSDCESVVSIPRSGASDAATAISEVSSVPASFDYDAAALRKELLARGEAVGPITSTTKKVYLRRLYRLQKQPSPHIKLVSVPYPPELQRVLFSSDWEAEVLTYATLEVSMKTPFEKPDPSRRWREGVTKSSFNYLLLDPRITCNLPASVTDYSQTTWHQFVSAIFYIGKGKRSRPYAHLYQAVRVWNKGSAASGVNDKVKRIMDIWQAGQGVVCLHVYQNVIPVEAFTREAAMLDAIGLQNVVNAKSGEYYGPAATWRIRQKRRLGAYLLYRAMRIFLSEGERQLRPSDID